MKKLKSLVLILSILTVIFGMNIAVYAQTEDGVEVTVTADKESYVSGDEVKLDVKVQNDNAYSLISPKLTVTLPEGLTIDGKAEITYTFNTIGANVSQSAVLDAEEVEDLTPDTGDSRIAKYIIICIISLTAIIAVMLVRKKKGSVVSLLLALTVISGAVWAGADTVKAEDTAKHITGEITVLLDNENAAIKYDFSYKAGTVDTSADNTEPAIAAAEGYTYVEPSKFGTIFSSFNSHIGETGITISEDGFTNYWAWNTYLDRELLAVFELDGRFYDITHSPEMEVMSVTEASSLDEAFSVAKEKAAYYLEYVVYRPVAVSLGVSGAVTKYYTYDDTHYYYAVDSLDEMREYYGQNIADTDYEKVIEDYKNTYLYLADGTNYTRIKVSDIANYTYFADISKVTCTASPEESGYITFTWDTSSLGCDDGYSYWNKDITIYDADGNKCDLWKDAEHTESPIDKLHELDGITGSVTGYINFEKNGTYTYEVYGDGNGFSQMIFQGTYEVDWVTETSDDEVVDESDTETSDDEVIDESNTEND